MTSSVLNVSNRQIQIAGNVTFTQNTTLIITNTSAISVSGCASLSGQVVILLNSSAPRDGSYVDVLTSNSSCINIGNLSAPVIVPSGGQKSCSVVEGTYDTSDRSSLKVLISITNTCKKVRTYFSSLAILPFPSPFPSSSSFSLPSLPSFLSLCLADVCFSSEASMVGLSTDYSWMCCCWRWNRCGCRMRRQKEKSIAHCLSSSPCFRITHDALTHAIERKEGKSCSSLHVQSQTVLSFTFTCNTLQNTTRLSSHQ